MVIPPPGSIPARDQGCVCPRVDNAYGYGLGTAEVNGKQRTVYVTRDDCPLHAGDWQDRNEEEWDRGH